MLTSERALEMQRPVIRTPLFYLPWLFVAQIKEIAQIQMLDIEWTVNDKIPINIQLSTHGCVMNSAEQCVCIHSRIIE